MTSSFALLMLRSMAVKGVMLGDAAIVLPFATGAAAMATIGIQLGDKGIALAFAAIVVAALMFVGGGDGVRDIVALLRESWICYNCANTR
jgi:hypothetical protein